jgi:hypothetical protein
MKRDGEFLTRFSTELHEIERKKGRRCESEVATEMQALLTLCTPLCTRPPV